VRAIRANRPYLLCPAWAKALFKSCSGTFSDSFSRLLGDYEGCEARKEGRSQDAKYSTPPLTVSFSQALELRFRRGRFSERNCRGCRCLGGRRCAPGLPVEGDQPHRIRARHEAIEQGGLCHVRAGGPHRGGAHLRRCRTASRLGHLLRISLSFLEDLFPTVSEKPRTCTRSQKQGTSA
jgi:hypothetical protein